MQKQKPSRQKDHKTPSKTAKKPSCQKTTKQTFRNPPNLKNRYAQPNNTIKFPSKNSQLHKSNNANRIRPTHALQNASRASNPKGSRKDTQITQRKSRHCKAS